MVYSTCMVYDFLNVYLQNVSQHQPQVAQPQPQQHHPQQHNDFPRQSSLEATWQDLVNILDLPNSNRTAPQNASLPNQSVAPMPNTSSMLIQNASMPTPAPMGENVTFNNSGRFILMLTFGELKLT